MQRFQRPLTGAALVLLAAPAAAEADTVNIYNWSDYIGETTLADFTAATGTETVYDTYDNNEILEAKLLAGSAGYDVVVPTAQPFLSRQIKAGVYMPLDKSKIPNWQNLDPALLALVETADPGSQYAAIWQWGTTGIGYNDALVKARLPDAPLDSWDLVFKPENAAALKDCGIGMLDSPTDILPIALHYLGLDPNSESEEDLAKAEELLMGLRPNLKYLHSSQYINDLANGNLCVAIGWSGDVGIARSRAEEAFVALNQPAGAGEAQAEEPAEAEAPAAEGEEEVEVVADPNAPGPLPIRYVIPKEGTVIWFDTIAIPTDAPNPDGAHAFINFILDPAVMAGISDYVTYANAVPASRELMDPAVANDPSVFPPPDVQARLFAVAESSQAYDRLRTRMWTRLKTGQ